MQKYYIKTKRMKTAVMTLSAFLLFVLSFAFFFPPASSPEGVSATTGVSYTNPPVITMETGRENAKLELNITNSEGTFATSKEAEKADFKVYTDNYTGYRLTVEGSDNTGALTNPDNGASFTSIDAITTESDFSSEGKYNGRWGFKPSKYNSKSNTQYLPSPTAEHPILLDNTTEKNIDAQHPNEYTIGIGARANYSTTSGRYSNTYIIKAVANEVGYEITYSGSVNDGTVTFVPEAQTGNTDTDKVKLREGAEGTPTRTGYTFLRWCLAQPNENGTICPESTATFDPGDDFGLDQTSDNKATLYAVWSPNIAVRINEHISEVSLNNEPCNITVDLNASATGCIVTGLENGVQYDLVASVDEGYHLTGWELNPAGMGTIENAQAASTKYTLGSSNVTITPTAAINQYTINLDSTSATTPGSESTIATYGSSDITPITPPEKVGYKVYGFSTEYNDASDATVDFSETTADPTTHDITSKYTFTGWYNTAAGENMVITAMDQLVPNTEYTNGLGKWTANHGTTLYAGWGDLTPVTLPKISKTNYVCGWADSTTATDFKYASGDTNVILSANEELYGMCTLKTYDVTVNFGEGITGVSFVAGEQTVIVQNTGGSGVAHDLVYGLPYTLTMQFNIGYEFDRWELNNSEYGTIGSTTQNQTTFTPKANGAVITAYAKASQDIFMQSMLFEQCSTTPMAVKDSRDNQTYVIQKLNDGNCWMMQNLSLGVTPLTEDLTSENTNLAADNTVSFTTFNGWNKNNSGATESTNNDGLYIQVTTENSNDGKDFDTNSQTPYGVLYNYYAASAGTISGDNNSSHATQDICPAGWRLPRGADDSANDYPNLYEYYKSNALMRAPAAATDGGVALGLSGQFGNNARLNQQGSGGFFWSSTMGDALTMYTLQVGSSAGETGGVSVTRKDYRDIGHSVRCVMTAVGHSIQATTMQDFSTMNSEQIANVIENMEIGKNYSLVDNRDGQLYTVSKMLDGNVWMTKNLNLGDSKYPITAELLNSQNTNMAPAQGISSFTGRTSWSSSTDISDTNMKYVERDGKDDTSGTYFGVLYNYAAATAKTIIGDSYNSAFYDICPAGWRLPVAYVGTYYSGGGDPALRSNESDEFYNLEQKYQSNITQTVATGGAAFTRGGYGGFYESGSTYINVGIKSKTFGYYWSSSMTFLNSTYSSTSEADIAKKYRQIFKIEDSTMKTEKGTRMLASYVRCILKTKNISDVSTLQEFDKLDVSRKYDVIRSMTPNTNYEMLDERDNAVYTIARLNDDRVWMTQNLRLGDMALIKNLNSENTNTNLSEENEISISDFYNWDYGYNESTYTVPIFVNNRGTDQNNNPYGVLYNYKAATATDIEGSSNDQAAKYDLCPVGWKMPYYYSTSSSNVIPSPYDYGSEFKRLMNYYTGTSSQSSIGIGGAAFGKGGYFTNTADISDTDQTIGYYWTRYGSGATRYAFKISGTSSTTFNTVNRKQGAYIRCVLKW